ncbi:outer membrane protein [Methylobacterium dankookense]|uniref:Outer membrane protein beta-barrel domain-containing protein n=1 Tax=Methylobacterium dankookense TaxID=560405 RepID=A0A564FWB2_9HYPH|nr:outer membrane beta-barrel protein [Methylobacterium dankookense]GJD56765.1 hypothetical protein IFDJLNFL_2662 [Methylobacterium dankookense]VUF12393.1 hypothetical protein MTDSW087_02083 [Methylobacterium dankookense]
MRTAFFAMLAACTTIAPVRAADLGYDFLRGADYDEPVVASTPIIDWGGLYVGAHGGYSNAALGFRNVFQPLVYSESRNTTGESNFNASTLLQPQSKRARGGSFGAYAGYNIQYGDVVFGFEGDYTRFDQVGATFDSQARVLSRADGILERVSIDGISSTRINEYGTVRGRLGYAYGSFLPYITGGLAIGNMQINDSVNYRNYGYNLATYNANLALASGNPAYVTRFGYAAFNPNNPDASQPYTYVLGRNNSKIVGGVALGAGVEFALTSNIILRGEYQYVLFDDFNGHKANVNTLRGGAAVKF